MEELVIVAIGSLMLIFQDGQATASRLSVFCISRFDVEATRHQFGELKASLLATTILTDARQRKLAGSTHASTGMI